MISFYPGPSRLHPGIGNFMQEAVKDGILSVNHRSKEFVAVSQKTINLLKRKLGIPSGYSVFFTSSATECWEIIAQSLISSKSLHLYNGAFGEKWFEYTQKLRPESERLSFTFKEPLSIDSINESGYEVVCVTQNETSNGTQISNKVLEELRKKLPQSLIAVDATSSLGGSKLKIEAADIWLASVQKCFGLPAGMGLLICSPYALRRAEEINERNHYNSLLFLMEKMKSFQTTYTPNVLSIYLLGKVMNVMPVISVTDKMIRDRAHDWYGFLENFEEIRLLVTHTTVRSDTVIAVEGDKAVIERLKKKAKSEGILLGNGYGDWSENTFRIANFPSITAKEIQLLKKFLKKNLR